MSTPVKLYLVGGAVRDRLNVLNPSYIKDYDFSVEALDYNHMRSWLSSIGARIWQERPQFGTIRCRVNGRDLGGTFGGAVHPDGHLDADFVLCRRDGFYTDSRHPDEVFIGTVLDDLTRRDFTVNAMAVTPDGEVIDPHMGQYDLRHQILRAVGNASERVNEDPLRILRAMRFCVTKGFHLDYTLGAAMENHAEKLTSVSAERIQSELHRMFSHDTSFTLNLLHRFPKTTLVLFSAIPNLWLMPTLKERT